MSPTSEQVQNLQNASLRAFSRPEFTNLRQTDLIRYVKGGHEASFASQPLSEASLSYKGGDEFGVTAFIESTKLSFY